MTERVPFTSTTRHARAAWVRPRPAVGALRVDAGIAILLAFATMTTALLYDRIGLFERVAEPWVWAVGIGSVSLPLALRRWFPVPVAVLVATGFFVCGQFAVPEMLMVQVCLFVALYTVGAWERNRKLAFWGRAGITLAMFVWVVVDLIIASADTDIFPGLGRSGIFSAYATMATLQIITNLLYFGSAIYFGERSWRAARLSAMLNAQGHELELERQTSAAQAVALDRLDIARELHDVVAHHVSVMGIQAAAARRSLADSPARATSALEAVEESAHSAVAELRSLVHTLRSPESEEAASTVGVAQLGALVREAQSTGTPTTLIVTGAPRPLPLLVDVALYRVVQEALTNVRKHAGRGASADVRLRFEADAVEVEVSDDGVRQTLRGGGRAGGEASLGAPLQGSGGVGLRGMRERVGAVGGTVWSGRRERGGFMVRANVPNAPAFGEPAVPSLQGHEENASRSSVSVARPPRPTERGEGSTACKAEPEAEREARANVPNASSTSAQDETETTA